MTPCWRIHAAGATALLLSPASPSYNIRDACPVACNVAGPNPGNWSAYHNFDQLQACDKTLFYDFSLYDQVDRPDILHRIYVCTSYGADWAHLESSTTQQAVERVDLDYTLGWWDNGTLAATDLATVSKEMRQYLRSEHVATDETRPNKILFAKSGRTAVGVYIGEGLKADEVGAFALEALEDTLYISPVNSSNVALQLCDSKLNNEHTFGLFASSTGSFTPVQEAIKTWATGGCLMFDETKDIKGPVVLTTSFPKHANNSSQSKPSPSSSPVLLPTPGIESRNHLVARADCKTTQVKGGDSCAMLATRCGISATDFNKYNPDKDLCSSLKPGQHVCCSAGTMPDLAPKPNPDGSCATYTIKTDDNCVDLAAQFTLEKEDLEEFNKKTWGWNGCETLWIGSIICTSKGTPPMPAPLSNAVCGPQKPGTETPEDTSDIADLNPCPLNACCNVWGQCGITDEFCTDTSTGAPGSAKPGTNGCISNCGMQIVPSEPPAEFRRIAYYQGYGFSSRDCLYQDALQVDGTKYTHMHFGFGELTHDYEVKFQDDLTEYQFYNFLRIQGPKKIISFGGWDFSTKPETYMIFREGVKPENRMKLATNLANFVKETGLDGIDLDWEYPGAPDIPGIPPDYEDSGDNYLSLLVILKNLLPGKSVSIAAASSYFYLKYFPIEAISKICDYIVFMTYDLHGQWDSGNIHAQVGCPSGNCLRSQVNLTETINAMVMFTKAGVKSNKAVIGVTSYGRGFQMSDPSCWGPDCKFTGGPYDSQATPGVCTATGGYIADAELDEIINGVSFDANGVAKRAARVTRQYKDATSDSDILIYDNDQWVASMSPQTKASRTNMYRILAMGGTSDWATDLQAYNDPPGEWKSWADFKMAIKNGEDPNQVGDRTGNWTEIPCTDKAVANPLSMSPSERWERLDAKHAWADVIEVWKAEHRDKSTYTFTASLSSIIKGPPNAQCGTLLESSNCGQTLQCDGFETMSSGAAGWLIWNSLVVVHQMYASYYRALFDAAASEITNSLDDLENKFAPIPAPPDDRWLLLLIDMITLGSASVAAPFFNNVLSRMPFFKLRDGSALDNAKDTTLTVISQSTTITKDMLEGSDPDGWTPEKQDAFSNYMGQSISAWGDATERSLRALFDGSDSSIELLTELISDGKLIEGDGETVFVPPTDPDELPEDTASGLRRSLSHTFYGFAIPTLWTVSGKYPFVVDSGFDCNAENPLDDYLKDETMETTGTCFEGKLYFLAHPDGEAFTCDDSHCTDNQFSSLPGVDTLDGDIFGGITVEDIIKGSVRTYQANGNTNGGKTADPEDGSTQEDLFNQDITTPGFIKIPVCTASRAHGSWTDHTNGGDGADKPDYPCNLLEMHDRCGETTWDNETSDASPDIEDCLTIVERIKGTEGEWDIENVVGTQHQLVEAGGCAFGIDSLDASNGNVQYFIGAGDIVDIIEGAIERYGGDGKVGAKGKMYCDGNTKQQHVEWGLY
ncbi:hypothetical protein BJY04DRAFT_231180 [Aspergillus karnatakaensis]|uniref:uncharacterized protein n=1 Tax=Aspergillus karnatakaensis TaxID=1810916 RepID=UPI003CCD39EB